MSSPSRKLLSTLSPEGIQVASQITPTRLANLLMRKGPLPIRHITAQLAVEVPSFDMLSLSKQRRLIMAAMDQEDPVNHVVFEKIGWGQWAVRKVDLEFIISEGLEPSDETVAPKAATAAKVNVAELRNQKLGWTKKKTPRRGSKTSRRTSITTGSRNLHNITVPAEPEPGENPTENAIALDSELLLEDEEIFEFDDAPLKFAQRVPQKTSPPPAEGVRRWSHLLVMQLRSQFAPLRPHLWGRLRLNSMETPLENYAMLGLLLAVLVASILALPPVGSPPFTYGNYTASTSEIGNPGADGRGRRKSLFNELFVRLTTGLVPKLVQLAPIGTPQMQPLPHLLAAMLALAGLDTDEEDWATIGPETLRQTNGRVTKKKPRLLVLGRRPLKVFSVPQEELNEDEKLAAMALVGLMH